MDFAALVVFLILFYIRPQEWIAFIADLKPVKLSVIFAVVTIAPAVLMFGLGCWVARGLAKACGAA
jgi:hypothetical protein